MAESPTPPPAALPRAVRADSSHQEVREYAIFASHLAVAGAALLLPGAAIAATYKVSAGAPPTAPVPVSFLAGLYDADAFYPGSHATLKIHKGDRVTFSGGFHTATILGSAPRGPPRAHPARARPAAPTPPSTTSRRSPRRSTGAASRSSCTTAAPRPDRRDDGQQQDRDLLVRRAFASPNGYTLKFNKTGTYNIVCLLHPGHEGQDPGPLPQSAHTSVGKVAKRARAEVQKDIGDAIDIDIDQPRSVQDPPNAVVTVGEGSARTSLFAFYPSALSVKVGTTVTFRSGSVNEPHNIGIGDLNYQIPHLALIDLFPNGPTDPNQVNPNLFYGSDAPVARACAPSPARVPRQRVHGDQRRLEELADPGHRLGDQGQVHRPRHVHLHVPDPLQHGRDDQRPPRRAMSGTVTVHL